MMWFSELIALYKADSHSFLIVSLVLFIVILGVAHAIASTIEAVIKAAVKTGMTPDDVASVVMKTVEVLEKKYKKTGAL